MASRDDDPWRLPGTIKGENFRLAKGGGKSRPLSSAGKARLRRIVNRTPEVMVKVTGRTRGRDGKHLKAHLDYVTRNGQIQAETQTGEIITDRQRLRDLHEDWMLANATQAIGPVTPRSAQSVGIILSMPPGTPADRVEAAGRTWARDTFGSRYDWLMARHDDTDHAHVHITVRAVGNDGRRLAPGPADLQEWREGFARELRRLGVEAEASPRHARGSVRKSLNPPAYQNLKRSGEPQSAQTAHAIDTNGAAQNDGRSRDWSQAIEHRQLSVRQSYLGHAKELAKGDIEDRRLARDIRRFVDNMPVSLARRQAIGRELQPLREQRPAPGTPAAGRIDEAPHNPDWEQRQEPSKGSPRPRTRA